MPPVTAKLISWQLNFSFALKKGWESDCFYCRRARVWTPTISDGARPSSWIRPPDTASETTGRRTSILIHDDVIKWKNFPRNWPFVRWIHWSPVNSPHKGQWRGALMFSLICAWINGWVNNREAGVLRRHRGYCDVIVMRRQKRRPLPP